ncbi:MAG: SusC/RagA family TonB-linked outer membrane protein [Gemmatimonadota bacterium]
MYRWFNGVFLFAFLALAPTVLRAQDREVRGVVSRSDNSEPISDAYVGLVGVAGRFTTRTNGVGRFTITIPAGQQRLAVRAIGLLKKEVPVGPQENDLTIILNPDVFKIEELVVTGQATGTERRAAATSTAIVSGEDITGTPAGSIDRALQGKIAGANIQTNSGAPGGGVQVAIRGSNTITGASDPLIVVDGVIISNASLPTGLFTATRSGAATGTGPFQDDQANRLVDLNPADIASIEILKSAAASSTYGSKAANGVVLITTRRGRSGRTKVNVTQRLGVAELLRGPGTRVFDTTAAFSVFSSLDKDVIRSFEVNGVLPTYDHLKEIAGSKPLSYETLADVSGGNDNTKFFLSGSVKQDNGIIVRTGAGRQTLRTNLDQKIADKLTLNFSNSFSRTVTETGFTNNDNSGAGLTYAIAYIPGFIPLTPVNGVFPQPAITYLGANPLQTEALMINTETVTRYIGGATLRWQALTSSINSLQIVGSAGADFFSQDAQVVAPPDLYWQASRATPGVATQSNGTSRQLNWNINAINDYSPAGNSWRSSTSLGAQYEDRFLSQNRVTASGLIPGQTHIDQAAVLGGQFQNDITERTFAGYAQEELYFFKERLNLNAGLRAERSSVFGNSDKFYLYPKVSARYTFPGLLGNGSEVKLRAAYGQTGNQPLFGQKFTVLRGGVNIGGNVGTTVGAASGSPDIRPERKREVEGGVDATFWHGRGSLQVTVYRNTESDLLLPRTPAPSLGYSQVFLNGGSQRNVGQEVFLGVTPVQSRDFTWIFETSFTRNRNKVLSLPFPGFRPVGAGFGLAFGEFFIEPGKPAQQIIGQTGINPDGTFIVSTIGDAAPDFKWSFGNNLSYKNLTLYALWDWQYGGWAQNQTLSLYDCNQLAPDGNTPEGQARADACLSTGLATPFVQRTTFLKLREVNLGYQLPKKVVKTLFGGAETVRLSLAARNLLIFTNYFGYDPESSNFGQQAIVRNIDLGPYPPSRTFFFNIAVGF